MLWQLSRRLLSIDRRALVMGIVNVTPDSFSDGGHFASTESAISHGLELVRQGADLLDIGGESTRPGAETVPVEEELRRVLPVIEALVKQVTVPLSVDTSKAEVARRCLAAGAEIVNDVTALQGDPEMAEAARNAGVILMHMRGTPATMQIDPRYDDVAADIRRFLEERLQWAVDRGIAAERVVLDPGIGFGKTHAHNLELMARLGEFQRLGRPVCLGASRKGFIGKVTGRALAERQAGSLAVVCLAVCRGAAQIVRVHDVADARDAVTLLAAIDEYRRDRGTSP